jgi:hypothetical protein
VMTCRILLRLTGTVIQLAGESDIRVLKPVADIT